jgi:putative DNA primase/helicase
VSEFAAIPKELRERRQWVVWRRERVKGRETKVPCQVAGPDRRASSTDPRTWAAFEDARQVLELAGPALDGVGYVLSADDPFVGFDFDLCATEGHGGLHPAAERYIRRLCGYTEWSPSGRGVRVIAQPELRGERHSTKDVPWSELAVDGRTAEFAAYSEARFMTLTGRAFRGGDVLGPLNQLGLDAVIAELLPERERPSANGTAPAALVRHEIHEAQGLGVNEIERLAAAFAAKNGEEIKRLWSTDATPGDRSESDLALARRMGFYFNDAARLASVLQSTGHGRWRDRRLAEVDARKALTGRTEFYSPPSAPAATEAEQQNFKAPSAPITEVKSKPAEELDWVVQDVARCGELTVLASYFPRINA